MTLDQASVWPARVTLAAVVALLATLILVGGPSRATTFQGEDGEIAFALRSTEGSSIYLIGPDGSNLRRIQAGEDPSWGPSGQVVAYSDDLRVLYAAASDGHQRGTFASCFYDEDPSWGGPADNRVAVVQRYGKVTRFALLDGDGSATVLATAIGSRTGIEWAPDSSALLVVYDGMIREFTPQGEEIAVFGIFGDYVERAAYSPDGERIIFDSSADGDSDIYVMGRDGTNLVQLTDEDSSETQAVFSPDSEEIVLVSDRDGDPDLYLMDSAGGELRRLTDETGAESAPDWGRHPGASPSPVGIPTASPIHCEEWQDRSVSLHLAGHLRAEGMISSSDSRCRYGSGAVKRKIRSGGWRLVRQFEDERFDVRLPDRQGRYQVTLRQFRISTYESRYETVCPAVTSVVRKHTHR